MQLHVPTNQVLSYVNSLYKKGYDSQGCSKLPIRTSPPKSSKEPRPLQ